MTVQMSEVEIELFPNPERLPGSPDKSLLGTIRHKAMDKNKTITFEIGWYKDRDTVIIADKYGTRLDPYVHGTINQAIAHFEITNPLDYRWLNLDSDGNWYKLLVRLNNEGWVYNYESETVDNNPVREGTG